MCICLSNKCNMSPGEIQTEELENTKKSIVMGLKGKNITVRHMEVG